MKRTRIHTTLIAAALLLVGAALAIGSSSYLNGSQVPPQFLDRASTVLLFDAAGNLIWSTDSPPQVQGDVCILASRVQVLDAGGQILFEGPVQWAPQGAAYPDAYVDLNGTLVSLEYLVYRISGAQLHGNAYGAQPGQGYMPMGAMDTCANDAMWVRGNNPRRPGSGYSGPRQNWGW
ncbi:hypothetical protein [Oceanithermus desulfurans]|uniref:Uncharacterized protein n=2 Tax=Oceanithermus desulfurans TaxID=227924 RepID=A0A511RK25_9DEIN|nr:hypothetical protein [Oceanithermus desulfurans]MBB6029330.1 hypothetical protein [Oceanithermus desulfurans]GEM90014.1 hypothetical protein ODE01S_14480 [Oceanithermus desulfurans NBRC 100063]